MEKGNGPGTGPDMGTGPKIASGAGTEGGGAVAGGASSGAATGTLSGTETGTGTAAAPPLAPQEDLDSAFGPGPGGGAATTQSRPPLPAGEWEYPDGSKLFVDSTGGAEYHEGNQVAQMEGDRWVDPTTGRPHAVQDLVDRAAQKLWELEQQVRLNPPS